ncbi:MAG: hypothetical protein IKW83_02570 [Muribaculaceae bacterium]|nr:hypothetical protein [Muribaculaceae bacterium]
MKKYLFLSLAFICCVFMGLSLTACGGDDEPIISNNIPKTELTTPLFLYEKPSTDLASTIVNGFTFWSFTDNKAAECSIVLVNTKPHLRCNRYEESWNIADGKLSIGSSNYIINKINVLGVKAYLIGTKTYFASNMNVVGVKAEDLFTKNFTKEQLWQVIDKAKASGQPEPLSE